jgi:hypothetical protein
MVLAVVAAAGAPPAVASARAFLEPDGRIVCGGREGPRSLASVLPDGDGAYLAVTWDPRADIVNGSDGGMDIGLFRLDAALQPLPADNGRGGTDPCGTVLVGGEADQRPHKILDEGGGRFSVIGFEASFDPLSLRRPFVGRFDREGRWLLDEGLGFPAVDGALASGATGAPDGAGGWFLAWIDTTEPPFYLEGHVVVRRVGATGAPLWDGPMRISAEPHNWPGSLAVAADGFGGAWVAWEESHPVTPPFGPRTSLQHVAADGSKSLGPDATLLLDVIAATQPAVLVPAGADVIAVVGRGGEVRAVRVAPDGARPWGIDGKLVGACRQGWSPAEIQALDAGDGSFYVVWTEKTGSFGLGERVDARRMRHDGTFPWPAPVAVLERTNGFAVGTTAALVAGRGLAVAAVDWGSGPPRDDTQDIFGQVIDRRGRLKADVSGAPVCTADFFQRTPRVFAPATLPGPDPDALPESVQALFLWSDPRTAIPGVAGPDDAFFVQGVTFTAQPSLLPPAATVEIAQGDSVTITLDGDDLSAGAAVEADPGIVVVDVAVVPVDPEGRGDRIAVSLRAEPGGVGAHGLAIVNPDGSRASLPEVLAIRLDAHRIDMDGSGRVDGHEVALLAAAFGRRRGEPAFSAAADIDGSGVVDGVDLALLAGRFGRPAID